MKKKFELHIYYKILAVYQIIGGGLGIILTAYFFSSMALNNTLFILVGLAISMYVYSVVCGILIFNKKDNNLIYSTINQYLQLINFSLMGYSFRYVAGGFLNVGIDFTKTLIFKFEAGLSTWHFGFNTDSNTLEININIVAILLISFIDRIKKKVNQQIHLDIESSPFHNCNA